MDGVRARMDPLKRYKNDRLWNINANIVFADVVSTVATALVIEALHARLPTRLAIVVVTAIIDGAISLTVFAILHTYANRARGVKDLARVQMHRWALSPLNYLIGAGLQYALLTAGVRVGLTVVVAYVCSMAVVRAIHTLYGKRSGLFR